MTSIHRAGIKDAPLIAETARLSFIESHGHSASPEDIEAYMTINYSLNTFKEELSDDRNIYFIIYHDDRAAGYSKIIFNSPYTGGDIKNITKLERIYILKEFYDLKVGLRLFQYNVDLAKQNKQEAIWLYVWKENPRAVNFYKRNGFVIIGSHDFQISERHANPNYQMLLRF